MNKGDLGDVLLFKYIFDDKAHHRFLSNGNLHWYDFINQSMVFSQRGIAY